MSYEFKEIYDKETWKNFEENFHSFETFFQSWEWTEFEKSMGKEIFRIGIYGTGKNELLGVMSIVLIDAKRGRLLHVRNGPLLDWSNKDLVIETIGHLKHFATTKNCSHVRISPLLKESPENRKLMKNLGLVDSQMHDVDAETTWILDVDLEDNELLAKMRTNTRYHINRKRKETVEIETSTNPEDLKKFWPIFSNTVERQDWKAYPYKYLYNEFKIFRESNKAMLILAKYDGQYIAGTYIIFHKGMAYCHHSASLTAYRKIASPYLVQWRAIQEMKARGIKKYNFFGIARTDDQRHPWSGLTFFKKGFGGYIDEHLHAHDIPVKKRYWLTHYYELIQRKLKGF